MRRAALLVVATAVAALLLAAPTPGASIAKAGQFEGLVGANGCGALQYVTVNAQMRINAVLASTNESGLLYAQVLGPAGNVVSTTGSYTTSSAGRYAIRACFTDDSGIDTPLIVYVGMVLTTPA